MNNADKRTPARPAACAGLILGRFRPQALPVLSGALAVAAAFAAVGCSAAAGTSASGNTEQAALAGATASGMGQPTSGMAQPTSSMGQPMSGTAQPTSGMGQPMSGPGQLTIGRAGRYQVLTLNDRRDVTFNQLLGINNQGVIAGYFGSGDAGHPNRGYELLPPFAQRDFASRNFPGSAQTQITGLNDTGLAVGFFSTTNAANAADNNNIGFWRAGGHYHPVVFPTNNNASPAVNQLLGINDTGTAVGFYNDGKGNAHGYAYNIRTGRFKAITVRGATSLTATAINNRGTVAGFYTTAMGATDTFLRFHHGQVVTLAVPGASATQAFGLNDGGEVVGTYTTGTGNNAVTHGFTWAHGKFATIDYPAASSTTINGVNDEGDIVGFYADAKGNTDGFVGLP